MKTYYNINDMFFGFELKSEENLLPVYMYLYNIYNHQ